MTEQELHDYNKFLMEVWNPNQLHIPFELDAPKAYIKYKQYKNKALDLGKKTKCDIQDAICDFYQLN